MRIFILIVLLLLVLPLPSNCVPQAKGSKLTDAKAEIEKRIAESGAETVAVSVYDTDTKQMLLINERVSLHAASTMKVPVMMQIFRLAEAKKLGLGQQVEIKNKFFSIADGSEYRLHKSDDSDEELYNRIGQKMAVLDLVRHMITMSSNLATNLLVEIAKPEHILSLMRELGANDIMVLRGVEDKKAFDAGKNNSTTAYDLMLLLRAIAENRFLNKKACEKMVEILVAQQFNEGIPAGLPTGTKVAHKTGDIKSHNHDAAIVYPRDRKPYVVVVLTKGIADHRQSSKLIAGISEVIYRTISQ